MNQQQRKRENRIKRHRRVRKTVLGTPERPRLTVFRSLNHIYAQVIDDIAGKTLASASTAQKELSEGLKATGGCKAAEVVGKKLAEKAIASGITAVVFDRGGYKYHGRVKALADAARKGGLNF